MADKVDRDLIRALAGLLTENNLTEIEWSEGDRRVRVVRSLAPSVVAMPQANAAYAAAPPAAPAASETAATAKDSFGKDHPGAVTSPMVGTVYVAPEPGAKPFVTEGATVRQGQTVLIVEAMKTMNPIPAPRPGTVKRILIKDSTPVEYGQLLMIIE
ncbi:MAG: acetyl-CoA carboxylase biotin carboxyl carrier protein [Alphaproteobacteria bacterium]|nr:acetyl-CoA carboxylase biotin carboxyl carrier protein [Alphaproteobacteria bacterium]